MKAFPTSNAKMNWRLRRYMPPCQEPKTRKHFVA
jgi:hypothetical protein